jgi:hypothetical protein
VAGTQVLCNLWLKLKGRNTSINNFKVVYTSPSSLEDYSNLKEIKERASIVNELVGTITANAPEVNSTKVLQELLCKFVPYQDFLDRINPLLDESLKANEDEGMGDEGGDMDMDVDMDFGGGGDDFSMPSPSSSPKSDSGSSAPEPKEEPSEPAEKPAEKEPAE